LEGKARGGKGRESREGKGERKRKEESVA